MQQQKWLWIPCAICLYLVADTFMTKPSNVHSYKESVKLNSLASTTPLFSDNTTEEFVLDCISGKVIGVRPRHHVDTVDIRQLCSNHDHKELDSHRKAMFNEIFHKRVWVEKREYSKVVFSASGKGSSLYYAQEMTAALHVIIGQLKRYLGLERVRLLDVPCGDMQWMSQFLQSCPGVEYTGVDIVADIISRHRVAYHKKPWKFINLDVVSQPINVSDYDLIITRMMMQHLPESDVFRILHNFSNITNQQHRPVFLLATTFSNTEVNGNPNVNSSRRFELFNLEIGPFRLQTPLCLFRDGPPRSVHFMGLWRLPLTVVAESSCNKPVAVSTSLSKRPVYSCINWTLPKSSG